MGNQLGVGFRAAISAAVFAIALITAADRVRAEDAVPAAVNLQKLGHGWRLTDAKGMTLYIFDRDQVPGKSFCNDQCAAMWPPLAADADSPAAGEWSKIVRDDKSPQWAFRGKPLYAYSRDVAPGNTNGDGAGNFVWSVAFKEIAKSPSASIVRARIGFVLADVKRMTLYVSDIDAAKKAPSCDAQCARTWRPLRAPLLAVSEGDWSVVTRKDGSKQWAYKAQPLYTYSGDVVATDTLGHDVDKTWHAIVLQQPPPFPDWVTVQASDDCDIFGDERGMTIYVHDNVNNRRARGPAMRRPQDWIPVLAKADAKPVGDDWTIVAREDGTRQWAYKGLSLYTSVWDKVPGNLNGHRRDDLSFRVVTVTGEMLDGTGA